MEDKQKPPKESSKGLLRKRELRARRRSEGRCLDCEQPRVPGRIRCQHHLALDSARVKKHKTKRAEAGRCYACGRPIEDTERNAITCSCIADYKEMEWN